MNKIQSAFGELDQFERIELLQKLTTFRPFAFREKSDVVRRSFGATIPRPEDYEMDYGRGFINVSASLARDPELDVYWVTLHFTNIDDGSWDFYGPKEDEPKANKRFEALREKLESYQETARWPNFDEMNDELQEIGLYHA